MRQAPRDRPATAGEKRRSAPRRKEIPGRRRAASCRCAGHRAILIFGSRTDRTIRPALAWALAQTDVQHKVHYRRASTVAPPYLPRAGGGWIPVRDANGHLGDTAELGRQIDDCCFFEEIMVMAHGDLPGINQFLSEQLAGLVQSRPVRKFTVWICEAAADLYPDAGNNQHNFEKLCGLLVPKDCPCGCDLSLCDGRCDHPDGGPRAGYRCPVATETTTLYLAAWKDIGSGVQRRSIAVDLAIDPSAADGQVLGSPDGRMRRVTISADGSCRTTLETGANVFGGVRVRVDPGLWPAGGPAIDAARAQQDAQAMPPASAPVYTGPIAAACHARREGCLPRP